MFLVCPPGAGGVGRQHKQSQELPTVWRGTVKKKTRKKTPICLLLIFLFFYLLLLLCWEIFAELHEVFWQDGLIFLDNGVTFPDLAALIEHYYSHPLPHHGSLCLQKPYTNLLSTWSARGTGPLLTPVGSSIDSWFLLWWPRIERTLCLIKGVFAGNEEIGLLAEEAEKPDHHIRRVSVWKPVKR